MQYTAGIVTAMMAFSVYFIGFSPPDGVGMTQHGVVAVILALVSGVVAYVLARPRRKTTK